MRSIKKLFLLLPLISFGFSNSTEEVKIVSLKIASNTFSNWLEYEVFTLGEQEIFLSITNENGKIYHREKRLLYGEAYLEMDASDFPKGFYNIRVVCQTTEAKLKVEKI